MRQLNFPMNENEKQQLIELCRQRLYDVRLADRIIFVNNPHFELTEIPFALTDFNPLADLLRKQFLKYLNIKINASESKIALLISSGLSYDFIAKHLNFAKRTVWNTKYKLFKKIENLNTTKQTEQFDTKVIISLIVNRLLNQLK